MQVHPPSHPRRLPQPGTHLGLRGRRVNAHMPWWIAPLPKLSASAPDWASEANTKNFIDVPFDGFLAPSSGETGRLEYCTTPWLTNIIAHSPKGDNETYLLRRAK